MSTERFLNLLDNAVKFLASGTTPNIRVRGLVQSGLARIWVEDNGMGVAKQAQQRIFQVFERAAPGPDGTGIGLTIVREAVVGGCSRQQFLDGNKTRLSGAQWLSKEEPVGLPG